MGRQPERTPSRGRDADVMGDPRHRGVNSDAAVGADAPPEMVEARQRHWLAENAASFAAQAEWQERNSHPLAEIMVLPGVVSWTR